MLNQIELLSNTELKLIFGVLQQVKSKYYV